MHSGRYICYFLECAFLVKFCIWLSKINIHGHLLCIMIHITTHARTHMCTQWRIHTHLGAWMVLWMSSSPQTGFSLKFDYELEGGGGHCYNYLLCVAVIVHFLDWHCEANNKHLFLKLISYWEYPFQSTVLLGDAFPSTRQLHQSLNKMYSTCTWNPGPIAVVWLRHEGLILAIVLITRHDSSEWTMCRHVLSPESMGVPIII